MSIKWRETIQKQIGDNLGLCPNLCCKHVLFLTGFYKVWDMELQASTRIKLSTKKFKSFCLFHLKGRQGLTLAFPLIHCSDSQWAGGGRGRIKMLMTMKRNMVSPFSLLGWWQQGWWRLPLYICGLQYDLVYGQNHTKRSADPVYGRTLAAPLPVCPKRKQPSLAGPNMPYSHPTEKTPQTSPPHLVMLRRLTQVAET